MDCDRSERDEAEREDAGRVGRRHRRAEQERVARLALRADEVARDERLPVTGRERVHGAPERRDQQREQDDPDREVAALDQRLEAAVSCAPVRRSHRSWAPEPRAAGAVLDGRTADVEWRAQEARRVGAKLVERLAAGAELVVTLAPSRP